MRTGIFGWRVAHVAAQAAAERLAAAQVTAAEVMYGRKDRKRVRMALPEIQ